MRQTHLLLAGTCAISLGIGYFVGSGRSGPGHHDGGERDSMHSHERSSSKSRQSRGSGGGSHEILSSVLGGKQPAELEGKALANIIRELARYDASEDGLTRTRRMYQFQLLLSKLSADQLQEAAEASLGNPEAMGYGGLSSIIAAMTVKNQKQALAWAEGHQNNPMVFGAILNGIAKDNPQEAARRLKESITDGTLGRSSMWEVSYSIGTAMAKQGKDAFLSYVDSLPRHHQDTILSSSMRDLPEADRIATLDEIYRRSKEGEVHNWTLRNLLSNLTASNPESTAAWIAKLEPGKDTAELEISQAGSHSQRGDEAAARECVTRALAQMKGREKELLNGNNSPFGGNADLLRIIRLLPDNVEIRADDLKDQARNAMYNDMGSVADLAGAIKDPKERVKLLTDTLTLSHSQGILRGQVNENDLAILESRIAKLNLGGEDMATVTESLAKIKKEFIKKNR